MEYAVRRSRSVLAPAYSFGPVALPLGFGPMDSLWPKRLKRLSSRQLLAPRSHDYACVVKGAPSAPAECWSTQPIMATHKRKLAHMHAALNPSPRKRRPEEGEGMGDEWERGGGVTGRYWTEVSRRVAASV
eukprot:scaffold573_cov106-Isochrysis_galbana.AAC.3